MNIINAANTPDQGPDHKRARGRNWIKGSRRRGPLCLFASSLLTTMSTVARPGSSNGVLPLEVIDLIIKEVCP